MEKRLIIASLAVALCVANTAVLAEEVIVPENKTTVETVESVDKEKTEKPEKSVKEEKKDKAKEEKNANEPELNKSAGMEESEKEDKIEKEEKVKKNNGKSKIDKEQLAQKKVELKEKKADTAAYIKEIKALFREADNEARKEILADIAEVKRDLKDYSIGTFIKGIEVDYDKYDGVKPKIENGRTLVPIRAIAEIYEAAVIWDEENQTITITKDETVIIMQIDNLSAKINDEEVPLEVAPKMIKNRTLVPIRFVLEALGLDVEWDQESRTIIVE